MKKPYCSERAKIGSGYNVYYRYLIGKKMKFSIICNCDRADNARRIAILLNRDGKNEILPSVNNRKLIEMERRDV